MWGHFDRKQKSKLVTLCDCVWLYGLPLTLKFYGVTWVLTLLSKSTGPRLRFVVRHLIWIHFKSLRLELNMKFCHFWKKAGDWSFCHCLSWHWGRGNNYGRASNHSGSPPIYRLEIFRKYCFCHVIKEFEQKIYKKVLPPFRKTKKNK